MVEEDKNSDFGDYGDESSDEDDSDGEYGAENANKWVIELLGKYQVWLQTIFFTKIKFF